MSRRARTSRCLAATAVFLFGAGACATFHYGPRRRAPPGVPLADSPRIDVVLISRDHYDHLDRSVVRRLGNGPRYFVPLGLGRWLARAGVHRFSGLDWGQASSVGPLTVHAVPAKHGSGRRRWFMEHMHMDPPDAVPAFREMGAELGLAMHWGTFKLAEEPLSEPPRYLKKALLANGLDEDRFRVLGFGQTISVE